MPKKTKEPEVLPGLRSFSRRYAVAESEVAVIRHATRALILDPGLLERMEKYLPEEHRDRFYRVAVEVAYKWWLRSNTFGLPYQYIAFTDKHENLELLPEWHPKRFKEKYRPPGRPKGSKDRNRDPSKKRGRPIDPDKWRSLLPYPSHADAIRAQEWCQLARIPLPASTKRALGLPFTELEGREEVYCITKGIPWHEYVYLRRNPWVPQDPQELSRQPKIPKLPAPFAELVAKYPMNQKRSEVAENGSEKVAVPEPRASTLSEDELIKERLLKS